MRLARQIEPMHTRFCSESGLRTSFSMIISIFPLGPLEYLLGMVVTWS